LVPTDFKSQHTAFIHDACSILEYTFIKQQSIFSSEQRDMRFESFDALFKQFVLRDIRRVADEDIDLDISFFEGFKQIPREELDIGA